MMRSYEYRLYPNKEQIRALGEMFDVFRELYNAALQERRDAYQKQGVSIRLYDQTYQLKDIRAERDDLARYSSQAAIRILCHLDDAFQAFFRRVRNGEKPGFPRFKSRSRFKSVPFTYGNGLAIHGDRLYIKGVGEIKVKWSRPIPEEANVKSAVVKRTGTDKWFVIFQLELPDATPVEHEGPAVGIDLGVSSIVATSDGETVEAPRYFRKTEAKLRRQQRRLSRRKKWSKGWRRSRLQIAKTYEKIANRRKDFAHKLSRKLVDKYSLIAVEDLNVNGLAQTNLAKSLLDAGWNQLLNMLTYKAEEAGTKVVSVNPRNTSQVCSGCGCLVPKDLSVRVHECSDCGLVLDRDVNAARNILTRALLSLGLSDPALTWSGRTCVAGKVWAVKPLVASS